VPVSELIDVLQEHKEAGLIKAYGVSNWTPGRIAEANRYAVRKGYAGIVVNSPSLSLARINEPRWAGCVYADDPYIRWHEKSRMPLLAWASQASGFFSGTLKGGLSSDLIRVYDNAGNRERFERARQLALRKGSQYTANHIALAYVLNQAFPIGAIIGPQKVEHLRDSFRALAIQLSEAELRWLNLEADHLASG
jgi:Predicted oxidoreductases (related to aryl-alcohol dehydrogenases)